MCEIDWELLHKYLSTLIWPIFLSIVLLIFRKQLRRLINRITEESEKIEIPGILSANLKQVENVKKKAAESGEEQSEEINQLISNTVLTQLEVIKQLGERYSNSSFDQRRILESQIKEYSIGLTPNDIEPLINSKDTGHRIAAAMVLDVILYRNNIEPFQNDLIKNFLITSLDDSNSFLRYEALQIILGNTSAIKELQTKLESMQKTDKNGAIKGVLSLYFKNKK
ncbi:MAG: hypothetical protein RLO81_06705 [Fulvivirga sp.]|uniref:hypothetical protein n=1 Tax=Fulvivirga sp. TaxID=1931237 RepID=UPI0032EC179C